MTVAKKTILDGQRLDVNRCVGSPDLPLVDPASQRSFDGFRCALPILRDEVAHLESDENLPEHVFARGVLFI